MESKMEMNDYIKEVWENLRGMPKDAALELIEYYEEFLLDSGLTVEEVLQKYGAPKKFAQTLKMTYYLEKEDEPEAAAAEFEKATSESKQQFVYKEKNNNLKVFWMVILGIFASPILLPLAIAIVAVIFAILISIVAILLSAYVTIFALIAAGIFSIGSALALGMSSPSTTLLFVGAGLFAIGAGILLAPVVTKISKGLIKGFMMLIRWIGRKISSKNDISLRGVGQ